MTLLDWHGFFSWYSGSHWTIWCSRSSGPPWSARYARRERNWRYLRSQGRQGESHWTSNLLQCHCITKHDGFSDSQHVRAGAELSSVFYRVTMEQRALKEHLERTEQEWVQNQSWESCYFDCHQTSVNMTSHVPSGSDWPHWASWSFWTQWCQGKNKKKKTNS